MKAGNESMPDYTGSYSYDPDTGDFSGSMMVGNSGVGHARITKLVDGGTGGTELSLSMAVESDSLTVPEFSAAEIMTGAIHSIGHSVRVTTNNPAGYSFKVEMMGAEQRLVREDSVNGDSYINPTVGTGGLVMNSWGISLDNVNFRVVPESGEPLILRSTGTSCECGDSFGVYYGVRVNSEILAGDYVGTVVYSVVGN
jgi:hypothetical protein